MTPRSVFSFFNADGPCMIPYGKGVDVRNLDLKWTMSVLVGLHYSMLLRLFQSMTSLTHIFPIAICLSLSSMKI